MVCNVFYVFVQSVWLDLVLDLVLVISANPSEDSSVRIVCSARIPTQLKTCFLTHPCKYIPLSHPVRASLFHLWNSVTVCCYLKVEK